MEAGTGAWADLETKGGKEAEPNLQPSAVPHAPKSLLPLQLPIPDVSTYRPVKDMFHSSHVMYLCYHK